MPLPDYIDVKQGPAWIFGAITAPDVSHSLTLNGLVNAAARMSTAADLGESFPDELLVYFRIETATGTAPTAGNVAELFLLSSHDGTSWPGFATGIDGAYPPAGASAGTTDQVLRLLGPPVAVLVATPDADKILATAPVIWRPRGRYVTAIVRNSLGVAIKSEATPANNDSRVILVPRRVTVNEA